MTKDEAGKLFHITDSEMNYKRISYLVNSGNLNLKRGTIEGSYYSNELLMITDTFGFYSSMGKFMTCTVTKSIHNSNAYITSNLEEAKYNDLLLLISLNNGLKKDIDDVKKIVGEEYGKFLEYREKEAVYYELYFSDKEQMKFYVEKGDFVLSFELDMKRRKVSMFLPGMDEEAENLDIWNVHDEIKKANIIYGVDFLDKYKIKFISNGVIMDDTYYEDLDTVLREIKDKKNV
jgi:hypothetical protein